VGWLVGAPSAYSPKYLEEVFSEVRQEFIGDSSPFHRHFIAIHKMERGKSRNEEGGIRQKGARAKGESVAANLQAAARKRFCARMSVRVNNAK
jgi:hypothetical protein